MQGRIVEYVEHGKFICAAVMEEAGGRLRLLNQNGREVRLNPNRVVHQGGQGLDAGANHDLLLKTLQDTDAFRRRLPLPVSLAEIWQLVAPEPGVGFSPQFLAELCFGGPASDDQVAALLRAVFADPLYFKFRDNLIQAHAPEVVAQLLAKREEARQREEALRLGAEALAALWRDETPAVWPELDCLKIIAEHYLYGNEAEHWELARELLKAAGFTRPHDAFHLLVKAGRWRADENIPLRRYRVPVAFDDDCLAQAREIIAAAGAPSAAGRLDLRDLPVLTIDGASTRDFDDALHLAEDGSNFEVGIHISDTAHYLAPGSPLFKEAERRATSIYFPDATVPMLPSELSEGALSLLKDQDRLAISFLVTLSPEGEVLRSRIVRSLIRVKRQLSYPEAEALAAGDRQLSALTSLSQQLFRRRVQAGALSLPIPDLVFQFQEGRVSGVSLLEVDTPMRLLVSEFMVLANTMAASFLADRQEPGLYRTQAPARKRLSSQPEHDLYINFKQRRFLARGQLLTSPKRHDGVGAEQYTTVTSPIRRLLDLVIQHQIGAILAGRGARFDERELHEFASLITAAQARVNLVRQLRHRYWLFTYLAGMIGEYLPAVVLDTRNNKVQVVLRDLLFEAELPVSQAIRPEPGDTVRVRVAKSSPLDDSLTLEW